MRVAIKVATQTGTEPSKISDRGRAAPRRQARRARTQPDQRLERCDRACGNGGVPRGGQRAALTDLDGTMLYSTLPSCGMCTMATISTKVGRIVFGAGQKDVHRMYSEGRNLDTMDFVQDAYRDQLVIEGGYIRDECAALYYGPDDQVPKSEQGNL